MRQKKQGQAYTAQQKLNLQPDARFAQPQSPSMCEKYIFWLFRASDGRKFHFSRKFSKVSGRSRHSLDTLTG